MNRFDGLALAMYWLRIWSLLIDKSYNFIFIDEKAYKIIWRKKQNYSGNRKKSENGILQKSTSREEKQGKTNKFIFSSWLAYHKCETLIYTEKS